MITRQRIIFPGGDDFAFRMFLRAGVKAENVRMAKAGEGNAMVHGVERGSDFPVRREW